MVVDERTDRDLRQDDLKQGNLKQDLGAPALLLDSVVKSYGQIRAVNGVSLKAYAGIKGVNLKGLSFNQVIFDLGKLQMNEVLDYRARKAAGKPYVDPLGTTQDNYIKQMKKLGYGVDKQGKSYPLPKRVTVINKAGGK